MDSQTNSKEIKMIKSINNGEILREDNDVWWPFAKKNPISYRSVEEKMIEFWRKKIMKTICNIRFI